VHTLVHVGKSRSSQTDLVGLTGDEQNQFPPERASSESAVGVLLEGGLDYSGTEVHLN
jgi:hypothetical protein